MREVKKWLQYSVLWVCLAAAGCSDKAAYAGGKPAQSALPVQTSQIDGRQVEFALVRNNAPVVVFEHGLAGNLYRWDQVFPAIAGEFTALAYSRAGNGLSSAVQSSRDGEHAVEELRQLLAQQGLTPPYVLVGHSLGGLYMQWYARRYPDEVAALVLVDAIYPQISQTMVQDPPLWIRTLRWFNEHNILTPRQQIIAEINQIPVTAAAVEQLPANQQVAVIALRACEQDFPLPDGYIRQLYPQAEEIWVDAGHNLQWEAPEAVVAAIRKAISISLLPPEPAANRG